MATTTFIESGTAATQGTEFFDGTGTGGASATLTSDAQAVLGSVRSLKASSGASNGFLFAYKSVAADAGTRVSFGFRFTGTISPAAAGGGFVNVQTSGATDVYAIGLTSANKIVVMNDAGTALGTGTTVLSTSTDYRISFAYNITSTSVNSFKIYIGGVLELTLTNVTLSAATSARVSFGTQFDTAGANVVFYYAHIFADNGTAANGDPGNLRVTSKIPIANGTTNGFTGTGTPSGNGTGNARYVNERPINTSNFVSVVAVASAITEEYNIQTLSAGDNDLTGATIVDYTGWLYAKALVSETGKIIVNNVQSNIALVNANTLFTQIAGSATYPAGTGTDLGIITATTATTITLYEAGIIVAYIPAIASSFIYQPYRQPWSPKKN